MFRLGVVGIIIEGERDISVNVQKILTSFGDIIVGRMGVPDKENGISVISLIVKGTNERISAMTGQLGRLDRVSVKSAISSIMVN